MSNDFVSTDAASRRLRADRPSPAVPLLLLAGVVVGGIVMTFFDNDVGGRYIDDLARLTYWVVATLIAFAAIVLIARHQGYRRGVWVTRRVLVTAGVVALALVAITVVYDSTTLLHSPAAPSLPGDLTIRGNLPLLAITAGLLVWAYYERRPGLWVVAGLLVPLTLLANLYNMENLLFRLGVPYFEGAEQVANLGAVAIVLLIGSGAFALSHRHEVRTASAHR